MGVECLGLGEKIGCGGVASGGEIVLLVDGCMVSRRSRYLSR